jgi:hypothetical protein
MKRIEQHELYQNLSAFLSKKGIDLKEGSYAERIQKGCGLLTDAINLTQGAAERAKAEMDKKLDQMRQTIHEKTAPKAPPPVSSTAPPAEPPAQNPPPPSNSPASKAARRKRPATAGKPSQSRRSARK